MGEINDKATARPWHRDEQNFKSHIIGANGEAIGWKPAKIVDEKFMLTAVNAFDALVAALTELRGRTLEHFRDVHGAHGSKDVATTLDNADAALKLASEGELNR